MRIYPDARQATEIYQYPKLSLKGNSKIAKYSPPLQVQLLHLLRSWRPMTLKHLRFPHLLLWQTLHERLVRRERSVDRFIYCRFPGV